jgi:hypothetical protein
MLPHIPATIHPAHRIERTFPQSAKLKMTFPGISTPIREIGTHD